MIVRGKKFSSCPSSYRPPRPRIPFVGRRSMAFSGMQSSFLIPTLLLALLSSFPISDAGYDTHQTPISGKGWDNLLFPWKMSLAHDSSSIGLSLDNNSFALAADRTHRKDPLDGYNYYTGGWNMTDEHYWASVAFNAAPLFAIALIWFVVFGLVLCFMCCYFCCCRRRSYSYSRAAYALSLILLILFTCSVVIGSAILYVGQGKFHGSTSTTIDYVAGQANLTVDNLRNFSDNLSAAKKIGVDEFFLPADVQNKIDMIGMKLNSAANELGSRTSSNSKKINDILNSVRLNLIVIAAAMLLLAFIGFLFSILGLQFLVYILVIVGWILVTGTFILAAVSLIFHNVVSDTCSAMDDWVAHPHAHTALDDILPCVDVATANESLFQSKQVTYQLVNVVNQVIINISNNNNIRPGLGPLYYNQSGPLMPPLCNPYTPEMTNRTCVNGEVDFNNASTVWRGFICKASVVNGNEICTTVGRITPTIYSQMTASTNVSRGIYYYAPFFTQLADCRFVREAFSYISTNNCPGLDDHSKLIYIGLSLVSAAVMLSLIFWVIYARERRHRKNNKQLFSRAGRYAVPL